MYEYNLMYNAGYKAFGIHTRHTCAVQLNADCWELFHWRGFIELDVAKDLITDGVFIACFRGRGNYRRAESTDLFNWTEAEKNHLLAGLVEGNTVRGILNAGEPWQVCSTKIPSFVKDPNYRPPQKQKIFTLADHRKILSKQ